MRGAFLLFASLVGAGCSVPPFTSTGPLVCDVALGHGCLASETCRNGLCQPNGGGTDGGTSSCPALAPLPTWRRNMALGEWKELTTADLLSLSPLPEPEGAGVARLNGWSGFAADVTTSRLYLAAAGGKSYAGNEVYRLDLNEDAPKWALVTQPSPSSAYTSNSHYLDGRPVSAYPYYSTWFIEQRHRVYRFGANRAWGDTEFPTVDSWDADTLQWDPANSSPPMPTIAVEAPTTKDFSTGDVYQLQGDNTLARWNQASNTVTTLAPVEFGPFYKSPSVFEPTRRLLILFSDANAPGRVRVFDIDHASSSSVEVTGSAAAKVTAAQSQGAAFYDPCLARFVMTSSVGGEVSTLDPATWVATELATSGTPPPNADTGAHTLFQMVPKLGGYAYQPSASRKLFFLATRNP